MFPDGREWVGKGIAPDVLVKTTVAAVRTGIDPALEVAVKLASLRPHSLGRYLNPSVRELMPEQLRLPILQDNQRRRL
jgi:hypothetical protein